EDGSVAYILSKPVKRYEFAAGRILGTWAISFGFMLLMHSAIALFSLMEVDAYIQNYLLSSLICSLNILLVVILSSLLSLKLPDSGAVIVAFIICGISFVSDLTQKVLETDIAQQIAGDNIPLPSVWRQVYPQIFSLQFFSIKFMDETAVYPHHSLVHPVVNILFYIILFYALNVFIFRKKEIN
ncbi:MAG: hypothetical protein ACOCSE_02730, partial [Chitinivibrionales bacterium]